MNSNLEILLLCKYKQFEVEWQEEVLTISRIFFLVDMITNTKFSNCPNVFKICIVQQYNMHSKQQNTLQYRENVHFLLPPLI